MLRLIRFHWDCGRQGELEGQFVLDNEEWNQLKNLIGKTIYFGEVLGKHSEIYGDLEEDDIEIITEDQDWLIKAGKLGINLNMGYNPLDYYEPDEENEED